jgi:hypothetical protein
MRDTRLVGYPDGSRLGSERSGRVRTAARP